MNSNGLSHPRLKRGFSLIPMDDGVMLLRSADRTLVMRGESAAQLLPRLLPLMDGGHSLDEISATLQNVAASVVEEAVAVFAERDLLETTPTSPDPTDRELATFFDAVSTGLADAHRLQKAHILVVGGCDSGKTACDSFKSLMMEMGVGHLKEAAADPGFAWAELVSDCDLVMFMPDSPALVIKDALHAACLKAGVKLSTAGFLNTTELFVGPTVVPGQTACWKCQELRAQGVQMHLREYRVFHEFLKSHPEIDPVATRLPALAQALASLAAFEAVRILTGVMPPMTYGAMMTLNCLGMTLEMHDVLKLPRCPECSPVRNDPPRRIWSW